MGGQGNQSYFDLFLETIAGGRDVPYTDWSRTDIDNSMNSSCVYLNDEGLVDYAWSATDCEERKPFACESGQIYLLENNRQNRAYINVGRHKES